MPFGLGGGTSVSFLKTDSRDWSLNDWPDQIFFTVHDFVHHDES